MNKTAIVAAGLLFILSTAHPAPSQGMDQEDENRVDAPVYVGRISHVEGLALRYDPDETAWVEISEDSPFGFSDRLKTQQGSRAEIILPNNTWVRLDQGTEIELVSLDSEETGINLHYGRARFINKGSDSRITVATSAGQVTGPSMTSFDIYIENDAVQIIPSRGSVYLNQGTDDAVLETNPDSNGIVTDGQTIAAGKGRLDPVWNDWNSQRDTLWAKRIESGSKSAEYLPPALQDQAHVLQDNGVWERVYYDGAYGHFWRPVHVTPGWSPFAVGRWTVWYGDHVWIPAEPFGYVTHHYGSWVFVHSRWYWAPPLASPRITFGHPRWRIGFGWYPGRVAWIHSYRHVGWVPLAPHEPYYTRRHWGPRSVVVKNVHFTNIHVQKYANVNHAVVVQKKDLYRHDNYRNHRIQRPDKNRVAHEYRPLPVIDPKGTGFSKVRQRVSDEKSKGNERETRRGGKSAAGLKAKPNGKQPEIGAENHQSRARRTGFDSEGKKTAVQSAPAPGNRDERRPPVTISNGKGAESNRNARGKEIRNNNALQKNLNPAARSPANKAVSTGNGKEAGRISNKDSGDKGREVFRNGSGENPQGFIKRERSAGPNHQRVAPAPQKKIESVGQNRAGKQGVQKSIHAVPTPKRPQARSIEGRTGAWQTERRQNPVSNQVKKNSGRNQERRELKRPAKAQGRTGPRA